LDSAAILNWRVEAKIPTLAKTARMGHPQVQTQEFNVTGLKENGVGR